MPSIIISSLAPYLDKSEVAKRFDAIAHRYDLLQRLNPGYRKHLRMSAERLDAPSRGRLLDLCCGTGLSTEALVKSYPYARIMGLDDSEGMLQIAHHKPQLNCVQFVHGDAEDPKVAGIEGAFDGVLMAYGIRNITNPDRCLRNIYELLKPGGRVAFHEYSVQDSLYARIVWNLMAGIVIVPLGKVLTGTDELFRYLRESVNRFDGLRRFEIRMREAGFREIEVHEMDGWQRAIVHTITAVKPS